MGARLSLIVADGCPHDAPYFRLFVGDLLGITLPAVACLEIGHPAPVNELATDESSGQDGDHDVPVARRDIAIDDDDIAVSEIGRASCRERVGQSVLISGVAVSLKQ